MYAVYTAVTKRRMGGWVEHAAHIWGWQIGKKVGMNECDYGIPLGHSE